MARPLIAVDVPGCRQIVREARRGFLPKHVQAQSLANKIIEFMNLDPQTRSSMGRGRGRWYEWCSPRIWSSALMCRLLAEIARPHSSGRRMPSVLRFVAALGWVVLAVAYIARSSFVAAYADKDSRALSVFGPINPAVLSAQAMLEVAQAAARGQALPSSTRLLAARVARAEPWLLSLSSSWVRRRNGTVTEWPRSGCSSTREQRDPRAPAARFLLAEQYITQGRLRRGGV
jgi:hypothetical protein